MDSINNQTSNSDIFKLLNIPDDGSFIITNIEIIDNTKYIHIEKKLEPTFCPICQSKMYSKGFYTRKINHAVFQDTMKSFLIVRQRKWRCTFCNHYMNDSFPFLERYSQSTNVTNVLILNEFKTLSASTADIARRFNISDTQAHDIFSAFVDLPRLPLPEYISIDEVYLNISNRDKYAFVIMDFSNGQIVDIIHNRWASTLENYFLSIPLKERLNVKAVICDAYANYLTLAEKYFPNACTVLDSFHVVKWITQRLNIYVNKVLKKYKALDLERLAKKNHDFNSDNVSIKPSREVVLLSNYRWILLKNQDEINYSTNLYYHSKLQMNVDTYTIEKMFLALDPNFEELRDLKEDYIDFNNTDFENEFDVLITFKELIDKYKKSSQSIFRDFAGFLQTNISPIVNSFTKIKVYRKSARQEKEYYARLSNGPMESFNRIPKDLKRNSRGFSDFNYTRNRILWATRINPSIKGVPKTKNQIKTKKGKKRGPYKK